MGLIISRQTGAGTAATYDLGSLPLPDGRLAHQLSQQDLWQALKALKIPNIDPHMGSQELMISYCDHKATTDGPTKHV